MTDGSVMTIDQTVLVDQATTKLYALLVSCSSVCYEHNSKADQASRRFLDCEGDVSEIAKHEFVSRPRDSERTTRKPLAFFDRIKILLALGGLQIFFVWVTLDDNPILPVREAVDQTLQ